MPCSSIGSVDCPSGGNPVKLSGMSSKSGSISDGGGKEEKSGNSPKLMVSGSTMSPNGTDSSKVVKQDKSNSGTVFSEDAAGNLGGSSGSGLVEDDSGNASRLSVNICLTGSSVCA